MTDGYGSTTSTSAVVNRTAGTTRFTQDSRAHSGDDVSLPRHSDQRQRHDDQRRPDVHDERRAYPAGRGTVRVTDPAARGSGVGRAERDRRRQRRDHLGAARVPNDDRRRDEHPPVDIGSARSRRTSVGSPSAPAGTTYHFQVVATIRRAPRSAPTARSPRRLQLRASPLVVDFRIEHGHDLRAGRSTPMGLTRRTTSSRADATARPSRQLGVCSWRRIRH